MPGGVQQGGSGNQSAFFANCYDNNLRKVVRIVLSKKWYAKHICRYFDQAGKLRTFRPDYIRA